MIPPEQADNLEGQIKQLRIRGLDPIGAAVMQYADEGVYMSGDYLRTEERLLGAVGSEDSDPTSTWTPIWLRMGIRLAQQRIRDIQLARTPEGRAEIVTEHGEQRSVGHLSEPHWFELISTWDQSADPNGLALLEQGVEAEKTAMLRGLADPIIRQNEQSLRRDTEAVEAGLRLVVDYYRGLVQPQGN